MSKSVCVKSKSAKMSKYVCVKSKSAKMSKSVGVQSKSAKISVDVVKNDNWNICHFYHTLFCFFGIRRNQIHSTVLQRFQLMVTVSKIPIQF
jgi:hypothetical protein